MKYLILSILFIIPCSFLSGATKEINLFSKFLENNGILPSEQYLTSACTIYDLNGKLIREYGGEHCIFEDNGDYLISEKDGDLNYRDKFHKIIWSLPKFGVHHGLNTDTKGNFLVLSSEVGNVLDKKARFDKFSIVSKNNGRILFEYSLLQHFDEFLNGQKLNPKDFWHLEIIYNDAKLEASHANSFYEIHDLVKDSNNFKNGDYVVNVLGAYGKILIFDGNNFKLKKLLTTIPKNIHDVQVLPDGSLIYFNNTYGVEKLAGDPLLKALASRSLRSRIEIMDTGLNNNARAYFANDLTRFIMKVTGSVQKFSDGSILTLDLTNRKSAALFISKDNELMKKIDLSKGGKIAVPYIKIKKLSSFLKNNIGL